MESLKQYKWLIIPIAIFAVIGITGIINQPVIKTDPELVILKLEELAITGSGGDDSIYIDMRDSAGPVKEDVLYFIYGQENFDEDFLSSIDNSRPKVILSEDPTEAIRLMVVLTAMGIENCFTADPGDEELRYSFQKAEIQNEDL